MRLQVLGHVNFHNIRRRMRIGGLADISDRLVRLCAETGRIAGRKVVFTDLRENPDYGERSFLTPTVGHVRWDLHPDLIIVWLLMPNATQQVAAHEVMHAHLHFRDGYRNPVQLRGTYPFCVDFFAKRIPLIAEDLWVNDNLASWGFDSRSLFMASVRFLQEHGGLLRSRQQAQDAAIQWQFAEQLAYLDAAHRHLDLGAQYAEFARQFRSWCRGRAPKILRLQKIIANSLQRHGFDASEKVGRFVQEVTPLVFRHFGCELAPGSLQNALGDIEYPLTCPEQEATNGNLLDGKRETV